MCIDGWMECFGVDWIGKGDVGWGDGVKSGWVWLGLSCDWAIVCGVCYYRELLQMQHFHPEPRPRLVMANSADNTC